MTATLAALDRLDRKILNAMQDDGRITNLDLAEKIGLSATATAERVKRLTRDGYITGVHARLDPDKVGRGLMVFVELKLDRMDKDVFDHFATAVERAQEVVECHMVAGGFDYLLKARVADMDAYRHFLSDVLMRLPGVRETHTYPVMEAVKDMIKLPV